MTPDELELSRALAAAPWWDWRDGVLLADEATGRPGLRLLSAEHARLPWGGVPDLGDAATAGVLLGMLPRGMLVYDHGDEDGWEIREPLASGSRSLGKGPTLGVAAARALVELVERAP